MGGKERVWGRREKKGLLLERREGDRKGWGIEGEKRRGGEETEGVQRGGKERERRGSVSELLRSVLAADQPWSAAH